MNYTNGAIGPVFHSALLIAMLQQETWAPVVRAAIDEYLSKKRSAKPLAVPAAPLKPLIIRHAEQRGLAFPPEGYSHLKFIDFLDLFPSVVKTQRRPGQDALVAKVEHAELLAELSVEGEHRAHGDRGRTALRSDVFDAFTKILSAGEHYWYSKTNDEFVAKDAAGEEQDLVPLPPNTFEAALAERKRFADSIKNTDQQKGLLDALNDAAAPLRAFSQSLKGMHLEHAWHVFRFDRLVQEIKDWADSVGLDWNDSWTTRVRRPPNEPDAVTAREANAFLAGLMELGPDDAKRVMIPLDIVLKLIRRD